MVCRAIQMPRIPGPRRSTAGHQIKGGTVQVVQLDRVKERVQRASGKQPAVALGRADIEESYAVFFSPLRGWSPISRKRLLKANLTRGSQLFGKRSC